MSQSQVTYSLNRLVGLLNGHADAILRSRFDMTYSQFVFLLSLQGKKLSLTEVADRLGVSVAAVSKRVSWFDERGLIAVSADPSNAKRVVIGLTPAGRRLSERTASTLEQAFRDKFADVKGVNLESLNATVNKVIDQLALTPKENS